MEFRDANDRVGFLEDLRQTGIELGLEGGGREAEGVNAASEREGDVTAVVYSKGFVSEQFV